MQHQLSKEQVEENKEYIIAKWLEGSVTDTELNAQYDTDMSQDLKLINDATDTLDIPSFDTQALLSKIKADIHSSKPAKVSYLKYWVSGIAAILIGVLAFTAVMNQSIVVNNNTLTYTTHILPDGSTVHLNANSNIEYNEDFTKNRNISLDGEAFFEVQKGETFTVHTNNGKVTVLGTSFNVFSRESNFNVACKTGKVKVTTQKETILNPGDQILSIKDQILEASTTDIKQIASWRNGESIFKSSPISEVILAITAQYNYELKGDPLDLTQRFTGSFIHDDIDKALRMVFLPMGISYKLDTQNKIILIQ